MRGKEANAGSLRALLLVLALLVANLTVTCLRHPADPAATPRKMETQAQAVVELPRFADAHRNPAASLGLTGEQQP